MKPRILRRSQERPSPSRRAILGGIALSALAPLLSACVGGQSGAQSITDNSKVSQIQKGVTTKAQIQQMFGEPSGHDFVANGDEVWTYWYHDTHVSAATYVPVVGLFAGGADVKNRQLQVTFGPDGIVKAFGVTDANATAGHGQM